MAPSDSGAATRLWDPKSDVRIDLLPGASYSRSIDLALSYDLGEPGAYAVVAFYDPRPRFPAALDAGPGVKLWSGLAASAQQTLTVSHPGPLPAGASPPTPAPLGRPGG